MIVDEEQRFGVRQKELLRSLKLQVDVMSLSATPIPRTLQMSLSGIRDISVIETAAARPPRDPHVHRRVQGRPGAHRHREGAGPRGPGLLPAQPRGDDRPGGGARPRARARRARAGGAWADGRACAREGHAGVPRRRGRRAGDDVDHRERDRHPDRQHARRGARRHARPGAAVPDPRAHRAQRRARLRLPALPERRPADQRGGRATDHAERPHRPGRRLQDRHGRPRDPRRRQPARRRAERARRGRRLRDVRADARGGRERAGRRAGGAGGAGARRPAGHRLRAAGVHRLRGDQDRRAPAHRAGAHGRRARRRARRARRPLRRAARAGREPHHAAGDPHQGGGARSLRRGLPRQPPAGRRRRPGRRWATRLRTSTRACHVLQEGPCAGGASGGPGAASCCGGSRLRSMLYSPLVCLRTGRRPLGERIYEEAHRWCGPPCPRAAGAAADRLWQRGEEGPRRRSRRRRQRGGHAGAVRPDLGAG